MSVWVQLYYKGKVEPEGQPIKIKAALEDVADLTKEVKAEVPNALSQCDALYLSVYPQDTEPPFAQDKAINPGDPVPTGTTSRNPLIVVAPDRPEQQQQGLYLILVALTLNVDVDVDLACFVLQ